MPYVDPYTPATEGKVYVNNRGWSKDGEAIRAEVKREGVLFNEDATMVKAVSEVWPNIVGLGGDTIMILYSRGDIQDRLQSTRAVSCVPVLQ
jgi:hypothetical protein